MNEVFRKYDAQQARASANLILASIRGGEGMTISRKDVINRADNRKWIQWPRKDRVCVCVIMDDELGYGYLLLRLILIV